MTSEEQDKKLDEFLDAVAPALREAANNLNMVYIIVAAPADIDEQRVGMGGNSSPRMANDLLVSAMVEVTKPSFIASLMKQDEEQN